jgi:glucokinase
LASSQEPATVSTSSPAHASGLELCREADLIGVDIGGSAIKLGRFNRQGDPLAESTVPTPQPAMPGAVCMAVVEAIAALDPERRADRVGIGLPGPADREGRIARRAINLPGWERIPLADWLEPQIGRPVVLANDANCALLGEAWRGAAREARDAILLTLGTGVGGGVLIDGALFTGPDGAGAELGLIGVDPAGPPCHSGNAGSLEQYASISGLARLSPLSPEELCRRAQAGDPEARRVWERYGARLGQGLSSLLYVLTPRLVLLGGGLSAGIDHFLPALWRQVEARVLPESREGLDIRRCALGNGAGRLGAARLALERWQ